MTKVTIVTLAVLVMLFAGCEKKTTYTINNVNGLRIISNSTSPAEPDLKIDLTKLFTIEGIPNNKADTTRQFTDVCEMGFDSQDNLYILSTKSSRILKYSSDGKFISSFGGRGNGPGETVNPQGMLIVNDTIKVLNQLVKQMVNYNTSGNFLGVQSTKECHMPVYMRKLDDNNVSAYLCNWRMDDNKEYVVDYDFGIIDTKFNIKNVILKQSFMQKDLGSDDIAHPNTSGNNALYFSKISKDKFVIDVFDFTGKKLYQINKNCRRISLTEPELRLQSASWRGMTSDDIDKYIKEKMAERQNKQIISSMVCDNKERIWVFSAVERNQENLNETFVDVFKDGIFLNKLKLPLGVYSEDVYGKRFLIHNDKLLVLNQNNLTLDVYKYN